MSEINKFNLQEIIRIPEMLVAFLATQQQQIHSSQTQDLIKGDVEDKMVTLE